MESIGALLRNERERKGLTIQQVYEATKITVHNLAALEEDRFDFFPNRVYVRAFLRDYANFLGIDSSEVLARYEDMWKSQSEPEEVKPVARQGSSRPAGIIFFVIILILALGAASYYYYSQTMNKPGAAAQPQSQPSPSVRDDIATMPQVQPMVTPSPTPVPSPAAAAGATPAASPAPTPAPQQQYPSDKLVMNIGTFDMVWVRVKADGKVVFQQTMKKGEKKEITADKSIDIRVGKAGAVQLKLNGKLLQPLGPLGTPASATFKAPVEKPVDKNN